MNRHDPRWSYSQHHEHDSEMVKENELPSCYTDPNSIDAWLHGRMHNTILPLIKAYPNSTWLTVGDGKYGSDAYFLKTNGVQVMASSLSDITLKHAKKLGYLENVMALNAEHMDLEGDSYDFVLCKGAYHHFPRPPIAFYEMLRVCRKGVVLIEPTEGGKRPLDYLKILVKIILKKEASGFEPSGNYIYKADIKEIARMMVALNYELLSYTKLNDFYHPKLSNRLYRRSSLATIATRLGLGVQNFLCFLRLMNYGLVSVIAFKQVPSVDILDRLTKYGFKHRRLPENPYRK